MIFVYIKAVIVLTQLDRRDVLSARLKRTLRNARPKTKHAGQAKLSLWDSRVNITKTHSQKDSALSTVITIEIND